MTRVLLFGGSFDPIHHGHLIVSRAAAERIGADRVVLIPSGAPPHKSDHRLTPAEHRLEMCRLAVAGEVLFEVSDEELRRPGPHYTLHTVRAFRARLGPGVELCWLVGLDSLLELGTWYEAGQLVRECRIITATRPGAELTDPAQLGALFQPHRVQQLVRDILHGPQIDISATDIRERAAAGRSLRFLVPDAVGSYISTRQIYGGHLPHGPAPARS